MVSFQCDACCDVVKKPKLDQHRNRCWATFTCIDCSITFQNNDYKSHTSCISEAEKYEKSVYKGPKKDKNVNGKNQNNKSAQPQSIVSEIKEKKKESDPIKDSKKRKKVEESDSSSSSSSSSSSESEEEEARKKKKKLTVWSDKDLREDLHDNILLAIPAVVAKSSELTLKDVRKKVIKKISSHIKNKAKKDDIKEAFESLKIIIDKDGKILIQ